MNYRILQLIISIIVSMSFILTGCSGSHNFSETSDTNTSSNTKRSEVNTNETNDTKTSTQSESQTTVQKMENKKLLPATIVKNVDGDTVDINLNGKIEKVRMLCVDTPETHHPRLGVQPFGPEASDYTKKILSVGTKVEIEPGLGGGRDKYGRLLAYIYVNGKMFNEMLLKEGLARVAYIYAPNTQYVDEFYAIQKKAQKRGVGIWSIENYAQEDGYNTENAKGVDEKAANSNTSSGTNYQNNPSDDQETNLDCKGKIKGNVNSHIYHVPGGSYYDSTTDNIIWFCSEKEAQDEGYRKSKR